MKTFYSRFGTATRYMHPGLAGALADADEEDAYMGTIMVSGPAGSNASNAQGQNDFWSNVPDILTKALAVKQSYDLTEINKTLIKQGKPPLTSAQARALAPTAYVGLTSDTQRMLLIGGGILAGALILSSLAKRR